MRVDLIATHSHYLDHLAPIWWALSAEERGQVIVPPRLQQYAAALGLCWGAGRGDVLLGASWGDVANNPRYKVALMEHGVGQTYVDGPANYAGGEGRFGVDLFLCPSERVAAADRRWGETEVVGDPYLDDLRSRGPVVKIHDVCFSFHFDSDVLPETRSARAEYLPHLTDFPLRALGTGHPRDAAELRRGYSRVSIPWAHDLHFAIASSRVFVADNTSAMWYALALGLPLVIMNSRWYRRGVEHGLRFWEHADAGVQVESPWQILDAVTDLQRDPLLCAEAASRAVSDLFPLDDGLSAARAVEALRRLH